MKIYLCLKDRFKSKNLLLINRREKVKTQKFKCPKALHYNSINFDGVYENLEADNPTKKRKVLIVFDDSRYGS